MRKQRPRCVRPVLAAYSFLRARLFPLFLFARARPGACETGYLRGSLRSVGVVAGDVALRAPLLLARDLNVGPRVSRRCLRRAAMWPRADALPRAPSPSLLLGRTRRGHCLRPSLRCRTRESLHAAALHSPRAVCASGAGDAPLETSARGRCLFGPVPFVCWLTRGPSRKGEHRVGDAPPAGARKGPSETTPDSFSEEEESSEEYADEVRARPALVAARPLARSRPTPTSSTPLLSPPPRRPPAAPHPLPLPPPLSPCHSRPPGSPPRPAPSR